MSKIMRNGKEYASFPDDYLQAIPISWDDYNDLSEEEQMNGQFYMIYDRDFVTDADELWNEINEINNSLTDLIKVESYRCVYSINANTGLHLSPTDFGITEPTGYTPVAICRFNSGREDIYVRNVNIDSTSTAAMSVYNTSNANRTNVYAYMAIAYIKSDFVAV